MTSERLSPAMIERITKVRGESPAITTIADGRPNWIGSVDEAGMYVETEASRQKGSGPQLVPAWMINAAWDHLRSTGSLTNEHLVSSTGLNVKRSAAVCALLARFPEVTVASSRPIELHYRSDGR